jgi:hypothetical protein
MLWLDINAGMSAVLALRGRLLDLARHTVAPAGQHFLSHEDGFPSDVALSKGYQRRATLLVYLNDVLEVRRAVGGGGARGGRRGPGRARGPSGCRMWLHVLTVC